MPPSSTAALDGLLASLRDVEAEAGPAEGYTMVDKRGAELPSVFEGRLSAPRRTELLEAVNVVRWFINAQHKARPALASPWQEEWDFDRLHQAFIDAYRALKPHAEMHLTLMANAGAALNARADELHTSSRHVALLANLIEVAAFCDVLKQRMATRPDNQSDLDA